MTSKVPYTPLYDVELSQNYFSEQKEEIRFIPPLKMESSAILKPETTDDVKSPLLANGRTNGANHLQNHQTPHLTEKQLQHCHLNGPTDDKSQENSKAKRQLGMACILVVLFITSEVVGGYLSGSLAIMSDAAHMFSDLASFLISLMALHLSEKPARKSYTFGYKRAEILGALLSIVTIWYVTGALLYLAVHRLNTNEFEVESDTMMIVAGAAVLFNILLGILLHGVCQIPHTHSHGTGSSHSHSHEEVSETDSDLEEDCHNHQHQHSHNNSNSNINIRAALIHVIGDFLQSLGVLLSSIVIKFFPTAKWVDPACTIIFSVIVFCTTIRILRDTVRILMEGTPMNQGYDEISFDLSKINYVIHVHDLHIWSLTVGQTALSVHLAVGQNHLTESGQILLEASGMLKRKHKISSVTIQMEEYQDEVAKSCKSCSTLLQ